MGIDVCIETTSLTHRQLAERFASLEAELTDANAKMNEATNTVYRLQEEQKKIGNKLLGAVGRNISRKAWDVPNKRCIVIVEFDRFPFVQKIED